MPDVTVVIPTRDRVRLLCQTLRSVQRQRGVDLEVLVVDDGSVEDVGPAVHGVGDRRVRLIRHDRALGVSAARNRGIEEARGRWVAFLDDDDLWSPEKLVAQLVALGAAPSGWSASGAVTIDDSLQVLSGEHPLPPRAMVDDLSRYNSVPAGASSVLAERELLEVVGWFDLQLRHMSDWDMWIRLGGHGPPAVVDRPLVAYRLHAGAATMDTAVDPVEPLEEFAIIVRRYGIKADRTSIHRWIAWSALRKGDRLAAARAYRSAIREGDVRSLARLAVALVHPGVGKRVFLRPAIVRRRDRQWIAEASDWLDDLRYESSIAR